MALVAWLQPALARVEVTVDFDIERLDDSRPCTALTDSPLERIRPLVS